MKAVQVMLDPDVVARLDARPEVAAQGRSAIVREAIEAWLRARRERDIVAEYARAYADTGDIGPEWDGWEDQGEWPRE
jgi:predicted transcriptional regulator